MRIINLHDDIGAELRETRNQGKPLSFQTAHMNRLIQGEILTSAAVCWFYGTETFEEMTDLIRITHQEIINHSRLILTPDDLCDTNALPEFFLTAESLCGIHDHPEERIKELYDMGVRMASLTWNEENDLATGVRGDPARGLTALGEQVIHAMNETGMIVDVSHANETTFWDILRISQKPVIATHSNCRSLCDHPRNLSDQQIIAIANQGGLIGMNAYGPFIAEREDDCGALALAKHAYHIAALAGHRYVACGFDFTDYLEDYSGDPRHDLSSACQAQNFPLALKKTGFSDEAIRDITARNAFRFLKRSL